MGMPSTKQGELKHHHDTDNSGTDKLARAVIWHGVNLASISWTSLAESKHSKLQDERDSPGKPNPVE